MDKRYYVCDKDNTEIIYGYIDYNKIKGFKVKPQNKLPYDGVEVSRLTLVEPELIKKVLKRKITKKLNAYLQFLLTYSDDEDDDGRISLVIDDIQKYKNLIINKYSKFLDKKYITALLKQVSLVEKNLEDKLQELIKNEEKSHRSR